MENIFNIVSIFGFVATLMSFGAIMYYKYITSKKVPESVSNNFIVKQSSDNKIILYTIAQIKRLIITKYIFAMTGFFLITIGSLSQVISYEGMASNFIDITTSTFVVKVKVFPSGMILLLIGILILVTSLLLTRRITVNKDGEIQYSIHLSTGEQIYLSDVDKEKLLNILEKTESAGVRPLKKENFEKI